MPELPEVETVVRGLEPFLLKKKFTKILCHSPALRSPIPQKKLSNLCGHEITSIYRRAKYILIDFSDGNTMVSHLGMTGSFTVYPPERHHSICVDRHDHVLFTTDANDIIIYRDPRRFGMIDVVKTDKLSSCKPLENLGVEPLDKMFTAAYLHEKLASRSIAIKPAIMNQNIVVGVGNIYASEALFLSGLHPEISAQDVPLKKLEMLVTSIKDILTRAIESGGSTLRDYRHVGGDEGRFQFHFSVYDREGQACTGCFCRVEKTGGVQRIVQAGRSTFFCPQKQKRDEL